MPVIKTLTDSFEALHRLFNNATPEAEARELAVAVRMSGKLGLDVLHNYIGQIIYCSHERMQTIATMLEGMSNDGLDMVPLLPCLMQMISLPEPALRNAVIDIICRLGKDASIAENVALGCLRNQNPDICTGGAKILNAIAPWCGTALKNILIEMRPRVLYNVKATGLVDTAILRCRANLIPSESKKTLLAIHEPAIDLTVRPQTASDGKSAPDALIAPDLHGKIVIFADDDKQIQLFIGTLLRNMGAQLHIACDGCDSIRVIDELIAKNQAPDLAIMDLCMPGENGSHVLDYLRLHFPATRTPIIILTAVKDEKMIYTMKKRYAVVDYLIKPVPLQDFYGSIQGVLTGQIKEPVNAPPFTGYEI